MSKINEVILKITDPYWKSRIKKSIESVLCLYDLTENEIELSEEIVDPKQIYVAAVEECVLVRAKQLIDQNYGLNSLITLIEYRDKKVLFSGSNRSLIHLLTGKHPQCVTIKLPDNLKIKMAEEAKLNLEQIFEEQKAN